MKNINIEVNEFIEQLIDEAIDIQEMWADWASQSWIEDEQEKYSVVIKFLQEKFKIK